MVDHNFEQADVAAHFAAFDQYERSEAPPALRAIRSAKLVLCTTSFVKQRRTSSTCSGCARRDRRLERARFIGRVRGIAKAVAEAYHAQREAMASRSSQRTKAPRNEARALYIIVGLDLVLACGGGQSEFPPCVPCAARLRYIPIVRATRRLTSAGVGLATRRSPTRTVPRWDEAQALARIRCGALSDKPGDEARQEALLRPEAPTRSESARAGRAGARQVAAPAAIAASAPRARRRRLARCLQQRGSAGSPGETRDAGAGRDQRV